MQAALVAVAALTGCDRVFGVAAPIDGTGTDDANAGDRDEDGVLDHLDNCPDITNASQHDEDLDAAGDACDFCPHAPGGLTDGDQDRVGDLCDPAPQSVGDGFVLFDPFDLDREYPCGANPFDGFNCDVPMTGSVQVRDDALQIVGAEQHVVETYQGPSTIQHYEAAVRVAPAAPGNNFVRLIARSGTDVEQNYLACGVQRNAGNDTAELAVIHHRGMVQAVTTTFVSSWPPPPRLVMRLEIPDDDAAIATCRVRWDGGIEAASIALPTSERPQNYGVWTYEASAAFEYLVVVGPS